MNITSKQLTRAYDQIIKYATIWNGDDFSFRAFNAWEDWKSRNFTPSEYEDHEAFDMLDELMNAYEATAAFYYLDVDGTYQGEDATYFTEYDEDGEPLAWAYKPEILEAKEAAEKKVEEIGDAVYCLVWAREDAERGVEDEEDDDEE